MQKMEIWTKRRLTAYVWSPSDLSPVGSELVGYDISLLWIHQFYVWFSIFPSFVPLVSYDSTKRCLNPHSLKNKCIYIILWHGSLSVPVCTSFQLFLNDLVPKQTSTSCFPFVGSNFVLNLNVKHIWRIKNSQILKYT